MTPKKIVAGIPFQFSYPSAGFSSADEWGMRLVIRGADALDVVLLESEGEYVANVQVGVAGDYWFQLFAFKENTDQLLDEGRFKVRKNLSTHSGPFDGRTDSEKALDAIEAVLGKRATQDQKSYTINNRSLERMGISELLRLKKYYALKVRKERGQPRKQIKVRL
ncbi:MAG: hypothetical protein ACNI27_08485 [Desulfovibrio sp.]